MARAYIFPASGSEYCGHVSKALAEQFRVGVDCSRVLRPSGATLTSGSVTVTDLADNMAASGFLLSSAATIASGVADVMLKATGGTTGHRYKVLFALRDSRNEIFHEAIHVFVR